MKLVNSVGVTLFPAARSGCLRLRASTGKSVALRIVALRLSTLRDVMVGVLERPQSKSADFYRELGDIFSVKLRPSSR